MVPCCASKADARDNLKNAYIDTLDHFPELDKDDTEESLISIPDAEPDTDASESEAARSLLPAPKKRKQDEEAGEGPSGSQSLLKNTFDP